MASSTAEFLAKIWPSTGHRCVARHIKNRQGKMVLVAKFYDTSISLNEICDDITRFDQRGETIYFAVATFGDPELGRKAHNAVACRALFLDLDCGAEKAAEGKGYPTARAAAAALQAFVNKNKLPPPMIVNSGFGLHVYWPLDNDVDMDEWKGMALALKALALADGLIIDPKVPADAARILRPAGTHNRKNGTPRPVCVVVDGVPVPAAVIQATLAVPPTGLAPSLSGPKPAGAARVRRLGVPVQFQSQMQLSKVDPLQFNGRKIIANCQVFQWAMDNQEKVGYDLWIDIIHTLYNTDEPDLIYEISEKYPTYDKALTLQKAKAFNGGGISCAEIASVGPTGCCNGCPHQGKIHSPSALGFKTLVAPPPPKINTVTGMPDGWQIDAIGTYFVKGHGDETQRIDLFPGEIILGEVYTQANEKSVPCRFIPVLARAPGGVREGVLEASRISTNRGLLEELLRSGISPNMNCERQFLDGMRSWIAKHLNVTHQAKAITQLGWTTAECAKDDASFVLGNRMFNSDGSIEEVRLDNDAARIGEFMTQAGDFLEWQKFLHVYKDRRYLAHAVVFLTSFAAPLARLVGIHYPIIHMTSQGTGMGKTGVQIASASVWGNPLHSYAMIHADATDKSVRKYQNITNGIPQNVDEISRMSRDAATNVVYDQTQPSGRYGLTSRNNFRDNFASMSAMTTSANVSLQEICAAKHLDSSPQQARIFEITMLRPDLTAAEHEYNRKIFALVQSNYGWAGEAFIRYVVTNQAQVRKLCRHVESKLRTRYGADDSERYWIAIEVGIIVSAVLCNRLGITPNWDIDAIVDFLYKRHIEQRKDMQGSVATPEIMLAQFLQANQTLVLTVDHHRPPTFGLNSTGVTIEKYPASHANVQMRYALADKKLFVARTFIRGWFAEKGLDFRGFCVEMRKRGVLVNDDVRMMLTAFTKIKVPSQTLCLEFNTDQLGDALEGLAGDDDQQAQVQQQGQLPSSGGPALP